MQTGRAALVDLAALDDDTLVHEARSGNTRAVRTLIQRHNQRLYRIARGVVGNDAEAEDVLQEAYLRAFTHLDHFRGEARFTTWMTRIVLNDAFGRLRRRRELVSLNALDAENGETRIIFLHSSPTPSDPEADAARAQLRRALEHAIDDLPDAFRTVFVMREIEEMSVEETASHLEIPQATVKTRLHRARRLLRHALEARLSFAVKDAFSFDGLRCQRIAERVLQRLTLAARAEPPSGRADREP